MLNRVNREPAKERLSCKQKREEESGPPDRESEVISLDRGSRFPSTYEVRTARGEGTFLRCLTRRELV